MDLIVLSRKISSYRTPRGHLKNILNELLEEYANERNQNRRFKKLNWKTPNQWPNDYIVQTIAMAGFISQQINPVAKLPVLYISDIFHDCSLYLRRIVLILSEYLACRSTLCLCKKF